MATGAIHPVCSLRTQPQAAAPLAILQFDLGFLPLHPSDQFHDCLSIEKYEKQHKKALAPISRPRARFSYDDLLSYLVRIEDVTAAWRLPPTLFAESNPLRSRI